MIIQDASAHKNLVGKLSDANVGASNAVKTAAPVIRGRVSRQTPLGRWGGGYWRTLLPVLRMSCRYMRLGTR